MESRKKNIILALVACLIFTMFVTVFLLRNIVIFFDIFVIGTLAIIIPLSIIEYMNFRRIKNCEDEFPNFLRDIAEAKRSGLSIIQSIESCAKADYGMLSPEVVKMRNQLTWNIPLKTVLERFRKKFRKSSIISHSSFVLMQIEESGGNTEEIMESLADSIETIKETQMEKRVLMNQHIVSMYAIYFIFFGISIALINFLLPLFSTQEQMQGLGGSMLNLFGGNPCKDCAVVQDSACATCDVFAFLCTTFSFGEVSTPRCYYKAIFFLMIVIQGIFSGLVIGQIGSESLIAGTKHSIILTMSGFTLFLIVSYMGIV